MEGTNEIPGVLLQFISLVMCRITKVMSLLFPSTVLAAYVRKDTESNHN